MKKILIIGANGFTGRQIVNDLSACKQYKLTGCSLHPDILPNNAEDYRFIETWNRQTSRQVPSGNIH